MTTDIIIVSIRASALADHLNDLRALLIDSVADGASISFMHPLPRDTAQAFWTGQVQPGVAAGAAHLFGAFSDGRLVGTVQLVTAMPPNQPHRAEIAKMIVHPDMRRRGIARALMQHALDTAEQTGKRLVTLDTREGDVSEHLYASMGFERAGCIPDFAMNPHGTGPEATVYMYRHI